MVFDCWPAYTERPRAYVYTPDIAVTPILALCSMDVAQSW
jgi:hypothetical protein